MSSRRARAGRFSTPPVWMHYALERSRHPAQLPPALTQRPDIPHRIDTALSQVLHPLGNLDPFTNQPIAADDYETLLRAKATKAISDQASEFAKSEMVTAQVPPPCHRQQER